MQEVKSLLAALDIRPRQRCSQGGNGLRRCRPKNFCSVSHHSTVFTQNLGQSLFFLVFISIAVKGMIVVAFRALSLV